MAKFSLAGGGAPDPSPMLHNHLYRHHRPFHLTTLSCVAIVLCGLGASLSIMLLFWCFNSRSNSRNDQRRRGVLGMRTGPSSSDQERATRAKAAVGLLRVIESDDARRTDECCAVCLGEFGKKNKKMVDDDHHDQEERNANKQDEEEEGPGFDGEEEDEEKGESEIEEWEIRVLPGCGHCFHTRCIQLWLFSYLSCPLCRREVGTTTSGKAVARDQQQQVRSGSAVLSEYDQASSSGSLCNCQRNRSPTSTIPGVDNGSC